MNALFLSASVPVVGRGSYYTTANPFLIQIAVRELVSAVIGRIRIVWGGHPAITPMVYQICEDLGVDYSQCVILYQSRYFEDQFPAENAKFRNVVLIDQVPGSREGSLRRMREQMLSRPDLSAAVFIGGMEGIEAEYFLFKQFHPDAPALLLRSPGGAARQLAKELGSNESDLGSIDFARLFRARFPQPPLPPTQNEIER